MNRRKIFLRAILVLLVPVVFGAVEFLTGPEANSRGLATVYFLFVVGVAEVVILSLIGIVYYSRAFAGRHFGGPHDVLDADNGRFLNLKRKGATFLLAALLVVVITAVVVFSFVLLYD